jgi:hypothetical protein
MNDLTKIAQGAPTISAADDFAANAGGRPVTPQPEYDTAGWRADVIAELVEDVYGIRNEVHQAALNELAFNPNRSNGEIADCIANYVTWVA